MKSAEEKLDLSYAAIESGFRPGVEFEGITVAKATATNEETAQSEAELNYRVHDQHYTWNGKADLGGDYVEYGREHFEQEYSAGGYTYVSGVERFPKSFIDASRQ